jgi:hypothetical protein
MAIEANIGVSADWFTGEDKSLVFTVNQSDGSTAQDITGWSLSWMLKRAVADADADALITKTTGSGIALTTPASGICTVTIDDTDTDSLEPGTFRHELKRTGAGVETILSYGTAVLKRAVHRS